MRITTVSQTLPHHRGLPLESPNIVYTPTSFAQISTSPKLHMCWRL